MTEFDSNYIPEDIEKGERAVLCPICGTAINNNPADLLFDVEQVDSDFRIRTLQDDLLDDWLIMCPECYYIDHDFSEPPQKENEIRAFVQSDEYKNLLPDNNPTTPEMFSVYLILITLQERDSYLKADCHLRMAWLYEDESDEIKTNIHRRKAIDHFKKTLLDKQFDAKQTGTIQYQISDIYRRLGEFSIAEKTLFNLDVREKTLKHLYDFQSKLLSERNTQCVSLPGDKEYEL